MKHQKQFTLGRKLVLLMVLLAVMAAISSTTGCFLLFGEAEVYVDNQDTTYGYYIYADSEYLGYVGAYDEETFSILLDGVSETVTLKAYRIQGGSIWYQVTATLVSGEQYTWRIAY